MEPIQFKTNIKCSGCVANVTTELNKAAGENNWKVDVQSTDKVLTIESEGVIATAIREAVEKAGYRAEKIA